MRTFREFPIRTSVACVAPLLAAAAAVTLWLWEAGSDSAAPVSLACTVGAIIASLWALLVAPSRVLTAAGLASLACAIVTAVLWWRAIEGILSTT